MNHHLAIICLWCTLRVGQGAHRPLKGPMVDHCCSQSRVHTGQESQTGLHTSKRFGSILLSPNSTSFTASDSIGLVSFGRALLEGVKGKPKGHQPFWGSLVMRPTTTNPSHQQRVPDWLVWVRFVVLVLAVSKTLSGSTKAASHLPSHVPYSGLVNSRACSGVWFRDVEVDNK